MKKIIILLLVVICLSASCTQEVTPKRNSNCIRVSSALPFNIKWAIRRADAPISSIYNDADPLGLEPSFFVMNGDGSFVIDYYGYDNGAASIEKGSIPIGNLADIYEIHFHRREGVIACDITYKN